MLVDDKAVMLRLAGREEFALRADEALSSVLEEGKPALLLQARPAAGHAMRLDLADANVLAAFKAGVRSKNGGWWDAFSDAGAVSPCLHGIQSRYYKGKNWAFEAHRDGHFVAALFAFPQLPSANGESRAVLLADLHRSFIVDFASHVEHVLKTGAQLMPLDVCATLVNADSLGFAASPLPGLTPRMVKDRHERRYVQTRIGTAQPGSHAWTHAFDDLARAVGGAYGHEM